FIDIYGIENQPSRSDAGWPTRLEEAIAAAGFSADDVTVVIDTHLHFDHAGGNTYLHRDDGEQAETTEAPAGGRNPRDIRLSFPRARYYVQRGEFEWAHLRNERIQASYLAHNFDPVMEAGAFELVDGEPEIVPGVRML